MRESREVAGPEEEEGAVGGESPTHQAISAFFLLERWFVLKIFICLNFCL